MALRGSPPVRGVPAAGNAAGPAAHACRGSPRPAADYHRFTRMLLRGGELDGVRLLSPRTVNFMTRNQLPHGQDLGALSTGGSAEAITLDGVGFGLGFAGVEDPVPSRVPSCVGE